MPTLPQTNRKAESGAGYDSCLTHPYALAPLLPYLPRTATLWESAAGRRHLVDGIHTPEYTVPGLRDHGYTVVDTDYCDGPQGDRFRPGAAPAAYDIELTNPPYSLKYRWIKAAWRAGKPWALLVPYSTTAAATFWDLWEELGQGISCEELIITPRINFRMPFKGWAESSAQLSTKWLTWGLDIGQVRQRVHLPQPAKRDLAYLDQWEAWLASLTPFRRAA